MYGDLVFHHCGEDVRRELPSMNREASAPQVEPAHPLGAAETH